MSTRSRPMMRPKEELKNQLLINFRKKNRNQFVDLQSDQHSTVVYYTPQQDNYGCQSAHSMRNRSVLDEFSKCPIREDQFLYSGEIFLNKFMLSKNRPVFPDPIKSSVSVQTEKNVQATIESNVLHTTIKSKVAQPTPIKVRDFDEKIDKSIIDVSGNLDQYRFPTSDNKNKRDIQKILTDSILGSSGKDQKGKQSQDSAEMLLKQLESANDDSLSIKKVKSEEEIQQKQPIIKKISLSRPRKIQQVQNSVTDRKEQIKQNKNEMNQLPNESDEKIQKLISKKSLIKSLIVKNSEANQKKESITRSQKNMPKNFNQNSSKWGKPAKNYLNDMRTKNQQHEVEADPLDLLPAYETSTSGLQAVIEEQNESEMQESIRHQANQQAKIQSNQSNKYELKERLPNAVTQSIKSNRMPVLVQESSQKQLKSISLGDISLEDVSQIENVSEKKIKNMESDKNFNDALPDYHESDNDEKYNKQKQQKLSMQKYIVNDISNDIKNLKKRISNDASFEFDSHQSEQQKPKKIENYLKIQQQKKPAVSSKGSEGLNKDMASMLDLFDEIHDKLDFSEVSKDINDLRDRIASESQ